MGCNVVSQYADEECGYLAQEMPSVEMSNFYLNTSTYYWEFLKLESDEAAQEGELSRIVLTDMYNYAFPMIRYDTGDLAIWGRPDKYSNGYPVITKLYGRAAQEGELSRIVLTDMYNYAFPMIRYDTGDLAIWGRPDKYSNGYPVITKLYGRKYDMVYNTIGEPVFPMVFARILKNYPEIQRWQFIQKAENTYVLKIVSKHRLEAEAELKDAMISHLGSKADISLVYIDDIPVLSSGKRKCVVNEISK
jgi:phenylacetate-CoA ligase